MTDVLGPIYQAFGGIGLLAVVVFLLVRTMRNDGFKNLRAAYSTLSTDRDSLVKRLDASDARVDALEDDVASLHTQLDAQTRWRRVAVRHIRDLREFIASRVSTDQIPPLPVGLDLDE